MKPKTDCSDWSQQMCMCFCSFNFFLFAEKDLLESLPFREQCPDMEEASLVKYLYENKLKKVCDEMSLWTLQSLSHYSCGKLGERPANCFQIKLTLFSTTNRVTCVCRRSWRSWKKMWMCQSVMRKDCITIVTFENVLMWQPSKKHFSNFVPEMKRFVCLGRLNPRVWHCSLGPLSSSLGPLSTDYWRSLWPPDVCKQTV